MTNIQQYAFPNVRDVQLAYGLSENPDLEKGRRTFDVCYDLEKVFDKNCYSNGKKFKKRVRQYLEYAEENKLFVKEIETEEDIYKTYNLYKEWNTNKLVADELNPNHYKEHSSRYKRCLDVAFEKLLNKGGVLGLFNQEGKLLSYQMYVARDDWAYGCTTASTKTDYTHIANVATVKFLEYFKNAGAKFANWGECGGDKNLLAYKETYPSFRIYYGELKLQFRRSSANDTEDIINFMNTYSSSEVPFPTEYMPSSIEDGNVTLVLDSNKLVGIVECRYKDDKYLMTNLIVDSEYRCQGVAKRLLEQLPKPFYFNCYKINEKANKFYRGLKNVKCIGESTNGIGDSWDYIYGSDEKKEV